MRLSCEPTVRSSNPTPKNAAPRRKMPAVIRLLDAERQPRGWRSLKREPGNPLLEHVYFEDITAGLLRRVYDELEARRLTRTQFVKKGGPTVIIYNCRSPLIQ